MKFLKVFGIILALLVVGYLVLCVTGPQKMDIKRTVSVDAPASFVFSQINDLQKWPQWSPWAKRDAEMKNTYTGNPGVGQVNTWKSETEGNGSQEIIAMTANENLKTKLNFEGMDSDNFAEFTLDEKGGKTDVSWTMDSGEFPFMFRGMATLLGMVSQTEKDYEAGLATLKSNAEATFAALPTKYDGFEVKETITSDKSYLGVRATVSADPAVVAAFYQKNLPNAFGVVTKNNVMGEGMPRGLFYTYDIEKGESDMCAAVPTSKEIDAPEGFTSFTIKGGKSLILDYYGDYAGTGKAHDAMEKYMNDRGLIFKGPAMEEYVTDPMTEPDPNKWLTKIYYPLGD